MPPQHDFDVANASGATFRADLNLALKALVANSSGATAPTTTFAFQLWADTTTGLLKIMNAANSAWVTIGTLASVNLGLVSVAGGASIAGQITWTNTDYIAIPVGTTAQRPGSPANGMIRYNTDLLTFEGYRSAGGGGWSSIGGGLGVVGASTGQLQLSGATAGVVTVQPQATAGTFNFNLPTTAGSSGSLLTSAGGGTAPMTWSVPGTIPGVVNLLLNSGFDFWQVGTTLAFTGNANGTTVTANYVADQWYANNILGGSVTPGGLTYSQVTGVTSGTKWGAQVKVTTAPTGTGIGNGVELWQPLSNFASLQLYGQTASFSVLIKATNAVNQVGVQFLYAATEVKPTVTIGAEVLTTVNSSTFTACTISGQAIGTAQTTAGIIGVRIRVTGVSSGNKYDLNNGFIAEQGVLNVGSVAMAFQRQFTNPATEIIGLQYFLGKSYDVATAPGAVTTVGAITQNAVNTSSIYPFSFKAMMRIAPIVTFYSSNTGASGKAYDINTPGDIAASSASVGQFGAGCNAGAGAAGHSVFFHFVADARI